MLKLSKKEKETLAKNLSYWRKRQDDIGKDISFEELVEAYRKAGFEIRYELYRLLDKGADSWTRGDWYKYNRMNVLQSRISEIVSSLGTSEIFFVEKIAKGMITEGYKIFNDDIIQINKQTFNKLASTKWSGVHYSERVWADKDLLVNNIKSKLVNGINLGESIPSIVKNMRTSLDVNYDNAERLVRTESMAYFNLGAEQRYKDAGIDKVIFLAELDNRTSDICREHDGKVFNVGEIFCPLHPNCRSTLIPYTELIMEEYKNKRAK